MAGLPMRAFDQTQKPIASPNRNPKIRRDLSLGLAGALVGALILAGCSSTPSSTKKAAVTSTTKVTQAAAVSTCPLTGTPTGPGGVPQRSALAVKVDNYPAARPQSGLDKADVIFEEPVEGGITRYVAVFQCQQAALVGPIRSARNIDIGILGQLGTPILAHVGGIDPVLANINASPLVNLDLGSHGSVIQHLQGRVAPYNTYASTAALWAAEPQSTAPPPALFLYSSAPPTEGTPADTVAIPFSGTSNVVWQYNPKISAYQRFYGSTPDLLANGVQNTAANVIVQYVQISLGPWLENSEGGLEVQAALYPNASGAAAVFRDGKEVTGTWSRGDLGSQTQFKDASGNVIPLQPGQTWVELVPNTIQVTATEPG
jgi:Protein of unknown function (DUF3048) N-terminal domain/Protein of unknown function (DUF3048) C-terminal domain